MFKSFATFTAVSASTGEYISGTIPTSAESDSKPFSFKASATAEKASGVVVTVMIPSSFTISSAPASRATSITSSSETFSASNSIVPFLWNILETEPEVPRFPPFFVKMLRTSAAARFLLSVRTSTITATPPAAYPS